MNKVALITGGSRGIGLGIAKHLAQAGFDLAINGVRNEDDVKAALDELRQSGAEVIYCPGDIGKPESRKSILDKVKNHFNRLHVLVNNAGVAPKERKDILESTVESFEYVINTNLKGTYFLSQAVANYLVDQKTASDDFSGCIINISSISSTIASVNRGEYCIAKAGLSMATQLLR
jgi:3-oxoacyl-[acyl-carrier protein] reductase